MTDAAIFLRTGDSLTPLTLTAYAAEKLMQQVLRDHPSLIAGVATSADSGRLLLIKREMPVAGPSGNSGLSLDHLFVDQTGIPVLVEAKRAENIESRRQVVAQMLDYAANGSVEWTAEQLRTTAEATAREALTVAASKDGADPADVLVDSAALLMDRLGVDEDPDTFWQTVVGNLRRGRMRLIFLADRIWPEMIRIIEFLNANMPDTEVLGIELPQYTGNGADTTVYVPRVVGRTAAAVVAKSNASSAPGVKWTEESLLIAAAEQRSTAEVALIRSLIQHVHDHHHAYCYWGDGTAPTVSGVYRVGAVEIPLWNMNVNSGRLYFMLKEYNYRYPASTEAYAAAVAAIPAAVDEVTRVRGVNWQGRAGIGLADATAVQQQVFSALDIALSPRAASPIID